MTSPNEIRVLVKLDGLGRSQYSAYKASAVTNLIEALARSQPHLHANVMLHQYTPDEFRFMVMVVEGGCVLRPRRDNGIVERGRFYARPKGFVDGDGFTMPFVPYQEPFDHEVFEFPRECILPMGDAMERIERYLQNETMADDLVTVPTKRSETGITNALIEASPYVDDVDAIM